MTSSPKSTIADLPPEAPGLAEIEAAAQRIAGLAVRTPLLESPALNALTGGRLLMKAEPLQRTGSFKFRGAYNCLGLIPEGERGRGVIAYSSGNHAQGVAAAAELYGLPATIVMPADAPAIKIANTKSYGAEVVLYDRYGESREEIAGRIMRDTGAHLIRPYDDPGIIAGQGTCALETIHQAETALDVFVACCGGGGLSAGCALAFAALSPRTQVYTAEPAAFDDFARSLESGTRQSNDPAARSICDALLSPQPGELTFGINKRLLAGGLRVTDGEVGRAMALAFHHLKVVVEPGGAAALAAVLSGKVDITGKTAAVTLSGGNVDPDLFCETIRQAGAG